MKYILKISSLIFLYCIINSCTKTTCSANDPSGKGVVLPNLENTKWGGILTSTGNSDSLKFDLQKNNTMKISVKNFTFPDTIGTWQIQQFTFTAKFVRRDGYAFEIKAPLSDTAMTGMLSAIGGNNPIIFNVKKQ